MNYILCLLVFCLVSVHDAYTAAAAEVPDRLKRCHQLPGHTGLVRAALYMKGGKVATGSNDTTVRVWDIGTQKCLQVLAGHTNAVTAVVNLVDSEAIVSGSDDGTARLWMRHNGSWQPLKTINPAIGGPARSLAIGRSGYIVLEKTHNKHIEYHPFQGTVFREGRHMDGGLICYEGAPDPWAAALRKAGKDRQADEWSGQMNYLQVGSDLPVEDVATYSFVLNSAEALAQGNEDRDPVGALNRLRAVQKMRPDCLVRELVLLSDGNFAVRKTDRPNVVQIMSGESGRLLQEIEGDANPEGALTALPDGGLAWASSEGMVDIYLYNALKNLSAQDEEKEGLLVKRRPAKAGGCAGSCVIS